MEQRKDVNFLSFSYFLVDASLDVFSVMYYHLYEILIASLRPAAANTSDPSFNTTFSTVIYPINGINFDSSIVIDILVGLASIEHLQPERNDHCLTK